MRTGISVAARAESAPRGIGLEAKEIRPTVSRKPLIIRIGAIVLPLAVWEGLVDLHLIDPFFFGKPSAIAFRIITDAQTPTFWTAVAATVQETLVGLAIGVIVGCALGFVFAAYKSLHEALDPIVYALYSVPRIALAPIFVLWFGIGPPSKVALAFSVVFFIMLLNTYTGIATIDRDLVSAVRLMGASRVFIHRVVTLPAIVPWLVAGFRLSASYALLATIVGEMIASEVGIGRELVLRQAFYDTSGIFALLVVVSSIAIGINSLVKSAERSVSRWRLDVTVTE